MAVLLGATVMLGFGSTINVKLLFIWHTLLVPNKERVITVGKVGGGPAGVICITGPLGELTV